MADTQREQLLCVRVGDQEFALSIRAIREIRGWITSTPLPHAPSYIKGMINLRGSVLAIIDLAERLGLPSVPPHSTSVVVVIEHGERVVGLLVDAVSDILTTHDNHIQPAPDVASELVRSFVKGLLPVDGRMISLISLDHVLPAAELEAA